MLVARAVLGCKQACAVLSEARVESAQSACPPLIRDPVAAAATWLSYLCLRCAAGARFARRSAALTVELSTSPIACARARFA